MSYQVNIINPNLAIKRRLLNTKNYRYMQNRINQYFDHVGVEKFGEIVNKDNVITMIYFHPITNVVGILEINKV